MPSRAWRLRIAALLGAGSFAVHQLRFLLAYGSHTGSELARQGHAYLSLLGPLLVALLLIAAAQFAALLVRPRRDAGVPRLRRLWAISTASLLAIYALQELGEGVFARGHAGGIAGIFGSGGWLAIPLAVVAGLVVALLTRGAAAAVRLLAARMQPAKADARAPARPRTASPLPRRALLRASAPRAPPAPSI